MQILVACELPEFALEELRALSSQVRYEPELRPEQLKEAIGPANILVVDGRRVSPEVIARAEALQMIVRAGPGPGEVALAEASNQGIFVTHCPDQHAVAIAELTFGLMLALDRRIVDNTLALREGRWSRAEFKDAQGLAGRTLGILGYGPTGREVALRAQAFGMNLLAWSAGPVTESGTVPGLRFCNFPRELARESDVVTVQPTGDEAAPMVLVDAEFLESMRPGAYLVHVGHPAAVDEIALAKAIARRKLRVAVDVFSTEPLTDAARFRWRLADLPGVIGTEHVGSLTEQCRNATAREVVRIIRSFVVCGEIVNCLNLLEHSPATWQLVLRVKDAVGVMASILDAIRADGINAEEISSRVFVGARAAWCTIALDERPSNEALAAIRALDAVLYCELRAVV
jgi:D-3-phosphoglycerate dehydrogenase